MALEFPNSNVCSTIGPGNFLITKYVRLTIYLSIFISNSHGQSLYTLSMVISVADPYHFDIDPDPVESTNFCFTLFLKKKYLSKKLSVLLFMG